MPAGAGPGLDRLADPALRLRLLQLCEHGLHVGERPVVLVGEIEQLQPRPVALEFVQRHPGLDEVVDGRGVDRQLAAEAVEVADDQRLELARLGEHPVNPGRVGSSP